MTDSGTIRQGFTLIELLAVIAIIATLAAILFPVFASARQRAKSAECISNLNQITKAILMYAGDNGGFWPYSADFEDKHGFASSSVVQSAPLLWDAVKSYSSDSNIWRCPSDQGLTWANNGAFGSAGDTVSNCFSEFGSSYVSKISNSYWPYSPTPRINPLNINEAREPSKSISVMDAWQTTIDGPARGGANSHWHRGRQSSVWNVAFLDGHVRSVGWEEVRYPKGRPNDNVWLFSAYWSRPEAPETSE